VEHKMVESSNIESVGYDESEQVLEVEFKNNTIYRYSKVPQMVFFELGRAKSVGKYFHQFVKDVYKFKKVE